jgi:hypothetical protein
MLGQDKVRLTLGTKNARKVKVESQFDSKKKSKERRGGRRRRRGVRIGLRATTGHDFMRRAISP